MWEDKRVRVISPPGTAQKLPEEIKAFIGLYREAVRAAWTLAAGQMRHIPPEARGIPWEAAAEIRRERAFSEPCEVWELPPAERPPYRGTAGRRPPEEPCYRCRGLRFARSRADFWFCVACLEYPAEHITEYRDLPEALATGPPPWRARLLAQRLKRQQTRKTTSEDYDE